MKQEEQIQVANLAIQFFDRVDMKGGELQAAMAVRGMLEGLSKGQVVLTPVQPATAPGDPDAIPAPE